MYYSPKGVYAFRLQTMFQSGEIIDTSSDNHKCDLLLKRLNRKDILIENKDYKVNVPKCEITKFVSDMTDYNSSIQKKSLIFFE